MGRNTVFSRKIIFSRNSVAENQNVVVGIVAGLSILQIEDLTGGEDLRVVTLQYLKTLNKIHIKWQHNE